MANRISRWEPFRDMVTLREAMDRLFEESVVRPQEGSESTASGQSLAVDVYEKDDALVVKAAVPGVKPEDIEISVTDDTLNLKAEARQDSVDQKEDFQRIEKRYRSFSRSISLPCRIIAEEVKATYKDDILRIELPKCQPKKARGVIVDMK